MSALAISIPTLVSQTALRYGVDPSLALSVARAESRFDPAAVSPAGAIGVMQLMPGTAADLGVTNPWDPMQNIDAGVRYLKQQLQRFGGNVQAALVAYNWGPANAQRWLSGQTSLPSETSAYVSDVLGSVPPPSDGGPASVGSPDFSGIDFSSLFGGSTGINWTWLAIAAALGLGLWWWASR